jgi:hypothetical protein
VSLPRSQGDEAGQSPKLPAGKGKGFLTSRENEQGEARDEGGWLCLDPACAVVRALVHLSAALP